MIGPTERVAMVTVQPPTDAQSARVDFSLDLDANANNKVALGRLFIEVWLFLFFSRGQQAQI
jgi:hypothetical protein